MERLMAESPTSEQGKLFQFEASINLPKGEITKLEKMVSLSRSAKAQITAPFRAKSYFRIENPRVFPLVPSDRNVSPDIASKMDRYEFYRAQLYCTFLPAKGCRFSNAQFEIALTTIPAAENTSLTPVGEAVAWDLYPRTVEDNCNINREYSVTPDLKFNFSLFQVDIAPGAKYVKSFIAYNSRIEA